jgi:two-component system, cell cycle response regulator DivK
MTTYAHPPTVSNGNVHWDNIKILVAEDEDVNFFFIEKMLETTKAEIFRANDGKEAIEMYDSLSKDTKIDLIVMDIRMPKFDGYEVTKKIRKTDTGIPIIAHTAYAFTCHRGSCISAGCTDYISKPYKTSDFLNLLGKYLNRTEE